MPTEPIYRNSEEIQEIITAVPSWILRRGILLIFMVLLSVVLLSAIISYPDVVKTPLKINSLNSPKTASAHQSGKLVKLLVRENEQVVAQQPLAFIESVGKHKDVILLAKQLDEIAKLLNLDNPIAIKNILNRDLNLGELQGNYQSFFQAYLQFINTLDGGLYLTQKKYLERDLEEIKKLQAQINQQKSIQEQEFANAQEEYNAYLKLKSKNVISNSEFKQQENKYLSSKYPLQQTATAMLNNNSSYMAKQKELATLHHTIRDEQAKFSQALNAIITETNKWLKNYVVISPIAGKLDYAGILQENQNVSANEELFIINPGNTNFFGEVQIPQYNMGKIKLGQRTLIKLRSYPFEEYGMIIGKISYLTDVAVKDSVFIGKIDLGKIEQKNRENPIVLKPGMVADAEIITQESSLLQRFLRNTMKMLNNGS